MKTEVCENVDCLKICLKLTCEMSLYRYVSYVAVICGEMHNACLMLWRYMFWPVSLIFSYRLFVFIDVN